MSKSKEKEATKETLQEVEKPTVDSSIEALKAQLKEYTEKAQYFKTMSIKAEGALEVLMQLKDTNGES